LETHSVVGFKIKNNEIDWSGRKVKNHIAGATYKHHAYQDLTFFVHMRSESTFAFLICFFNVALDAFMLTPNTFSHMRQVRMTHQVANLRIPYLQRKSEEDVVMNAPIVSNIETTKTNVESLPSTNTAPIGLEHGHPLEPSKELSESEKLLKQVKEAGIAGVVSYALWEIGFWAVSVPVVLFGYFEVTGHWPDLSDKADIAKLSAEAFAFVNFARFAVPLRIGLALSTTPWIQSNIIDRFMKDGESDVSRKNEF
jgi:hypothetical protein